MRAIFQLFSLFFLVGGLLAFSPEARAQSVNVEVRSIAASKSGQKFDAQLDHLRNQLDRGFAGYTQFQQVGQSSFKLEPKGTNAVSLPNGSTMKLSHLGPSGQFLQLGLNIEERLKTTLRLSPGSTFFQAGMPYKDGILIITITVR